MRKTYTYLEPYFTIEVTATTAFCALVVVAVAYLMVHGGFWLSDGVLALFGVAAIYQVWNVGVSRANPRTVTYDEGADTLEFSLYKVTHSYHVPELRSLLVRSNPQSGIMFLRVGEPTPLRGRYWVPTRLFSDGRELFDLILDLEYRVDPNSLRAQARRGGARPVRREGQARATHGAGRGERAGRPDRDGGQPVP